MTLSTPPTKRQAREISGFTLVEMLVVIGIIVLLIGILAPALNIAYTHSIRNRMMLDIQSISTALEAYKSDMRVYPTLDYSDTNGVMSAAYPASVLLCNALISPLNKTIDGADGPGFTIVPNGQVYGPYLEPSRFKLVADPVYTSRFFLADRYSHPILYFLANKGANVHGANGYVNYVNPTSGLTLPMYNLYDDAGSSTNPAMVWANETSTTNALERMRLMLGDTNNNGMIDGAEQAATTQSYLLWGAGPDEVFGIDLTNGGSGTTPNVATLATQVPRVDDTSNFRP